MACGQVEKPNPKPTCDNPVGVWHNDLRSSLIIKSIDAKTGLVTGEYINGGSVTAFPLTGWVNDKKPCTGKGCDHAPVISFSVRWGEYGSITAWVGTCSDKDGPSIKTMWNLARPNSTEPWDHILTGSDTFIPGPPPK